MPYYQEIEIPVRVIRNIEKARKSWIRIPKRARQLIVVSILGVALIFSQSYIFSAYEAHVINVTARICKYSETRTMGYWKNHPEVYEVANCLPLCLGLNSPDDCLGTLVDGQIQADAVFEEANANNMSDMLRGQLLAMKFNICVFGIGGYTVGEDWGTINDIVGKADELLGPPESQDRERMEEVKNILDYVNNIHQLRYCSENGEQPYFAIEMPLEATVMGVTALEHYCGDGELYAGEECDDGNLEDGDGCDSTCMIEKVKKEKKNPPKEEEEFEETEEIQEESTPITEEVEAFNTQFYPEETPLDEFIETVEEVVETAVDVVVETVEDLLGIQSNEQGIENNEQQSNEQETTNNEQSAEEAEVEPEPEPLQPSGEPEGEGQAEPEPIIEEPIIEEQADESI